jgi:nucleotidyltransferase/DNA polymerase involved in DNA repair
MSVLYCTVPHFAAALARRDNPDLQNHPLVLVGPEQRVLDVSAEAAACGVAIGMTARVAEIRCPVCKQVGRAVRQELGDALKPALGWDSSKFTAQAAARRTRPGHLLAVTAARERMFLKPLSVRLLPLPEETLQRLSFLGLRTLGQYAALPPAAVWQQFGRAGKLAHRYAQGQEHYL